VGHLLGRVLESEALESLALSGGFLALVASIELAVAAVELFVGAGEPAVPALPDEFIVFVALFFLLRRRHRLRIGQRQRIAAVGLAWPRFCMSALLSSTNRLLRLM
jgi:hypothetical protein